MRFTYLTLFFTSFLLWEHESYFGRYFTIGKDFNFFQAAYCRLSKNQSLAQSITLQGHGKNGNIHWNIE